MEELVTGAPGSAREEALRLATQALDVFAAPTHDPVTVVRLAYRICELLQWEEPKQWFLRELQGYSAEAELPWFRQKIQGSVDWRVPEFSDQNALHIGYFSFGTGQGPAITHQDFRQGVGWIQTHTADGLQERTGRSNIHITPQSSPGGGHAYTIYETYNFSASAVQGILAQLEDEVFRWVSGVYASLRYSSALGELWSLYTQRVDEKLPELGLQQHYLTIDAGLRSTNPQDWRAALWSCRDLLHDLASHLWQDPNGAYEYLPGKGKDGKLSVTESDYVNRIGAYLHQKIGGGTTREYLATEADRIYSSIDRLSDLASKGHSAAPSYEDARTAALSTYFLIGELVLRTDMVPVREAADPAQQR